VLKYELTRSPTEAEVFAASEVEETTMPEYIDEVKKRISSK